MESTMTFKRGLSGNSLGNRHHTRHLLNQRFLQALLLDFDAHGREAIEECRKQSPLGYVKVLGHLVPRELKIEQNQSVKAMSDEQLEQAIAVVQAMLEQRAGGGATVIEGTAETIRMLGPDELEQPQRKRPNPLLAHTNTAVGPIERKPRKREVPPPSRA
jgi:hypothetical protein